MVTAQHDVTAFVLAGGKSARMGSDKAFVQLNGRTLLERALETARAVTPEVIVVGERNKFSRYASAVDDVFRDRGPLGGIHAALAVTATDLNLILALDLPFIEPKFLKYLFTRALEVRQTDALVVLPNAGGGWQPLCAIYRKEFGRFAEEALKRGENKIDRIFPGIRVLAIEEAEIVKAGFSVGMFRNLNTPEELERAKKRR
jgi:molybdopterin-guanine dinucleotide biosynthesis protein A